jgi:hypothetical protein
MHHGLIAMTVFATGTLIGYFGHSPVEPINRPEDCRPRSQHDLATLSISERGTLTCTIREKKGPAQT